MLFIEINKLCFDDKLTGGLNNEATVASANETDANAKKEHLALCLLCLNFIEHEQRDSK